MLRIVKSDEGRAEAGCPASLREALKVLCATEPLGPGHSWFVPGETRFTETLGSLPSLMDEMILLLAGQPGIGTTTTLLQLCDDNAAERRGRGVVLHVPVGELAGFEGPILETLGVCVVGSLGLRLRSLHRRAPEIVEAVPWDQVVEALGYYSKFPIAEKVALALLRDLSEQGRMRRVHGLSPGRAVETASLDWHALLNLIKHLSRMLCAVLEGGPCILALDGLERIRQDEARRFFFERLRDIRDLGAHLVVTVPMVLPFDERFPGLRQSITRLCFTPATRSTPEDSAAAAVERGMDILERRLGQDWLDGEARRQLAVAAGGLPRDLLAMAHDALQEASLEGREEASVEDVKKVVRERSQVWKRTLTRDEARTLRDLSRTHSLDPRDAGLLGRGVVVRHEDPDGREWFCPHPLLGDLHEV